jgi:hypothetical protein
LVASWPPDVITTYGIEVLLEGIIPQITFVSYDGELIFYLLGGLAPIPGVTEGVVLPEGVAGLHSAFNNLTLRTARAPGDIYTNTVYDPAAITMKVMATARDRGRLRPVISQWMAAWVPEQTGILSWVTPDSGEWIANVRLGKATPDKLDYNPGVRSQKFTWSVINNNGLWYGPDSTSQFAFGYDDSFDKFARVDYASLGPSWAQTYTGIPVLFSANAHTPNIDQWWSAAAVTLSSPTIGGTVSIDSGATGTPGSNTSAAGTMTATCTHTCGSSANYVVVAVGFLAVFAPYSLTVHYGSHAMTPLGTSITGSGGIAFFGLSTPASGAQTVTATAISFGSMIGMTVSCASVIGWGSTAFTKSPGGEASSPSQTVGAVKGDLVLWGVANAAGSGVNTDLTEFNQNTLYNSGALSLSLDDSLSTLLGYVDTSALPTAVTLDTGSTGTVGTTSGPLQYSHTPSCTYTRGSSANYVVAAVAFYAGLAPNSMTVTYGGETMSLIGTSITGFGGIAFFGLPSPPSGAQTVTATVTSFGNIAGTALACQSFNGWGSTVYTAGTGGWASSPTQSVTAVSGDLVVWGVANAAGSNVDTTLSGFNETSLQNVGPLDLPIGDGLSMLLGYALGGTSELTATTSFSAEVATPNLDQWWSSAALTLLPPSATGTCGTDGLEALWTPNGIVSDSVINLWLGQNAVQTVTVAGNPTAITLTYDGETTDPITYPGTAASVQSALTALVPTIETGNVSVTSPVTFDAVGSGDTEDAETLSWLHVAAGNYVAAFISVYQGSVASITYGGTEMTYKTSQAFDNVSGNGYLYVYELALDDTLTGEQPVQVVLSGSTYATGNTVSYNNVGSSTAQTSVYGNGTACSMSTPSGSDVVVQAFASQLSALAKTGDGNSRYLGWMTELLFFDYAALLIQDGFENHTFSASLPIAQNWAGVELVLTATTSATTGPFAVEFVGALAKQAVDELSGTVTGGTNAYVGVAQTELGMEAVSATDNQIVSANFGVFYTWPFNDGAYVDLWGRWDGNVTNPTGIRMRIAVGSITLSRFNAGVETVMVPPEWMLITPFPQDTYSLVLGTSTNTREYQVQRNGITIYDFTEVDGGSALGAGYRNAGFGMTAGVQKNLLTGVVSQASPPTVADWSFADNTTITQSGHLNFTNFGDLEEFPDFLVYGPGTFTFGDGPGVDPTISFGPLADNQIALVRTNPSYRAVYDLSTAASQQVLNGFQTFVESLFNLAFNNDIPPLVSWFESLFGITPQQGEMYSLLNGRWSNGVPSRPTSGVPPTYQWAVTIDGGDASSKIIGSITPRRRWPE